MSILNANGSIACAKCGEDARAERDRLVAENAKLRELLAMVLRRFNFMCKNYNLCDYCPMDEYEEIDRNGNPVYCAANLIMAAAHVYGIEVDG